MSFIDLFIIVLIAWAVFRGFTRGLIKQLTMLAALILGIYGALKLSGFTAAQLIDHIHVNSEYLYLISLGLTFILVFLVVHLLGNIAEKIAESANMSLINRVLGVLFSLGRTVIVMGVLLAFVDRIDIQTRILPPNFRENSLFYKPFTTVARTLFPALRSPETKLDEKTNDIV